MLILWQKELYVTRTGEVHGGPLTEFVLREKEMPAWHLVALLILQLADPMANSSLDLAEVGFYWSSELL